MDEKQLITIVVTAVVSVAAKELITWMVSLLKNHAPKIKPIFTKQFLSILVDVFMIAVCLYFLFNFLASPAPATQRDTVIIGALFTALIVSGVSLLIDIAVFKFFQGKNSDA